MFDDDKERFKRAYQDGWMAAHQNPPPETPYYEDLQMDAAFDQGFIDGRRHQEEIELQSMREAEY